ncbi:UDP-GlcNAc--UDP-phosphate GlcNAc-1-phosphate transferase, partial [Pedobacter sp. HMWF019]|uniref:MraY family glycosyltransferase n=1 Tax=Pedobacter sp. HMWF019 TaxID=2056856 RepID=UPI000D3AF968
FIIADKLNIIDKPNERSSHTVVTIRGGGVIFLIAIIIAGVMHQNYWLPVLGATIIGAISFLDDRMTLSSRIRIIFHLIAVSLLFYFLNLFSTIPWWGVICLYIVTIGIINAYNFMDGINGITGMYSLVVLGGLQYVNLHQYSFIEADMIWLPMISCLVFLYFNFRKMARCFAGDVGSVTIAFWVILLLAKLILKTENYSYVLFLAVYGVDAVLTILHRLHLKQNIFDAHRLHFYQILANDQKIPHLLVSLVYAILQLAIVALVIFSSFSFFKLVAIILTPLVFIYIIMKPKLMLKGSTV